MLSRRSVRAATAVWDRLYILFTRLFKLFRCVPNFLRISENDPDEEEAPEQEDVEVGVARSSAADGVLLFALTLAVFIVALEWDCCWWPQRRRLPLSEIASMFILGK